MTTSSPDTGGAVLRSALRSTGGVTGVLVTAAPTVAFVAANAVAGLRAALVALGVVAVAPCASTWMP